MTTIKNVGHHGVVATGVAALCAAAVMGAQLTAEAVVYVGELLLR